MPKKEKIIVEILRITKEKKRFLPLLLLGDEDEGMIDRYLEQSDLKKKQKQGQPIGVCAVMKRGDGDIEIKNIAIDPNHQHKGYGKKMIDYVQSRYRHKGARLLVGTGDSPLTLPFYEKCGFTYAYRVKNFFTDHYPHPIYEGEGGKPLVDMIYLEKPLEPNHKGE